VPESVRNGVNPNGLSRRPDGCAGECVQASKKGVSNEELGAVEERLSRRRPFGGADGCCSRRCWLFHEREVVVQRERVLLAPA